MRVPANSAAARSGAKTTGEDGSSCDRPGGRQEAAAVVDAASSARRTRPARPIREVILEKKPTSEVRKLARQEGMTFLRESALERVRRGITTLKEINKVTFIEASR